MRSLARLYDGLIRALAILAGASIGFMTVSVAADVILRNAGLRPFQWTSAVVEYLLLFCTMAGGPWLVRTGGHVAINSFADALPDAARVPLGRAVLAVCAAVLALLAWRAGLIALDRVGAVDMRSVNIPGWIAYAMLSGGFALMAIEFVRLLAVGAFRAGGREAH
ncbi:TRAP transporter small permease [Salinarimonas sp.]|uniref:TRAP transporter small permease n=1 Tax=Salinarimonas sp. TaxID=2766526 RepID=UPI0032D9813B